MKQFQDLINDCLPQVGEVLPWDLREMMDSGLDLTLLDIREPYEFEAMHIQGSINVPRGILETTCEYGYEETLPKLVEARERDIVVIWQRGQLTGTKRFADEVEAIIGRRIDNRKQGRSRKDGEK